MWEKLQRWDHELLLYFHGLGNEKMDFFWFFITKTTSWIPLFGLIVFLLFKAYPKKSFLAIFLYFIIAVFLNIGGMLTIKYLVKRTRPVHFSEISDLLRFLHEASNYSFYSGHASFSFLFATLSYLLLKHRFKGMLFIFIFPVLFTYSRIYVGVHYPSDLIVGALTGISIAILCNSRIKKLLL